MTTIVIRLKRRMCEEAGGPADLAVQLDVRYPDGSCRVALVPESRDLIPDAVRVLRESAGQRESYIGFLADTWASQMPEGDDGGVPDVERDELEDRFKAGDMSVKEMLVVQVLDCATGDVHSAHVPYSYRDDGMPKFERVWHPERVEGAIVDLLREAAGL